MKHLKTYEEIKTIDDLSDYLVLDEYGDKVPKVYRVLNKHIKGKKLITIFNEFYNTEYIDIIKNRLLFQSDSKEECENEVEIYKNKAKYNL